MSHLFNYKTFTISLDRELKNCKLRVQNDTESFSSLKFIDELEKFFDWMTSKTEISSLLIETSADSFELLSKNDLKLLDENAVFNYLRKVQRLSWGQIVLPQTIVWNFQGSADFLALELASGADIRIAHPSFTMAFNTLNKGITPMASGSSLMGIVTNQSIVKANLLSNKVENATNLLQLGLIHQVSYNDEVRKTLKNIAEQSPIARIQFKRSINDQIIRDIDDLMANEVSFAKAALAIGDWKRWANESEFANPREFSKILRRTPTIEQVNERALA
ncbi:enoyl-CoA hydratase/isomerase family protein [Bacteriovorax sp. DB6_IX]|uniref:enoyl-CoA hydratase/isomerase family protein n=1 Tax=Bacteriovorax sp. DB6_IX TaxID=1353530 RepID=UPI00038A0591|nr:enoyl-CoA hydratase/isomerase family protein [Bacteriovorax sp. DB6_IX]EQC51007.1 enoyl-CoA hydratase/isomerase domain protein [Bacteriovorax sp. DB6_IX]